MSKRITDNLTLSELILGIIAWGLICQVALLFTGRPLYYSSGMWIGVVVASGMAVHMNSSLSKALDADEAYATKKLRKDSIIRYAVVLIIFAILMVTDICSPLVAFAGVMGLKVGAYLQPLTHNILRKSGPRFIKQFILDDDEYRKQLLIQYEEEQKRLEEEKRLEEQKSLEEKQDIKPD